MWDKTDEAALQGTDTGASRRVQLSGGRAHVQLMHRHSVGLWTAKPNGTKKQGAPPGSGRHSPSSWTGDVVTEAEQNSKPAPMVREHACFSNGTQAAR